MRNGEDAAVVGVGSPVDLGVPDAEARVWFGETPAPEGGWRGLRVLNLNEEPAFELSFWCGSCAFLFRRQWGANQKVSLEDLQARLADGLTDVAPDVVEAFGQLLGADTYIPVLLRVTPTLVQPMGEQDYFSHEQIATWELNSFWGLPESPNTPYYRTFQTAVDAEAHLYEFIAPMVPPSWNHAARVEDYVRQLQAGHEPTAVAVSTLDVCQSATGAPSDYYAHWGLTHFLLDGHHKVQAAASCGQPLSLLALIAQQGSLADQSQLSRLLSVRQQAESMRPAIS